eukprot:jgi/Chlat1/2473/Chrsp175S08710
MEVKKDDQKKEDGVVDATKDKKPTPFPCVAIYSTKEYDKKYLVPALEEAARSHGGGSCAEEGGKVEVVKCLPAMLTPETALLAKGCQVVSLFVNDKCDAEVQGYNNVDLEAAEKAGITVVHVPRYSPYAVAEHAIGLLLSINRKARQCSHLTHIIIHKAYTRVRENNFELNGLLGFDLRGKTVGVIGTGGIGTIVSRILNGFGCKLLGYDVYQNDELKALGMEYASLDSILPRADIITLHCPLLPDTYHIIGKEQIDKMKQGVLLINTSRGGLVDARAVIAGIEQKRIGGVAMDVYEDEANIFFRDMSEDIVMDEVFTRMLSFPNVLITPHQAFFTVEALQEIARVTAKNIAEFTEERKLTNQVVYNPPKNRLG